MATRARRSAVGVAAAVACAVAAGTTAFSAAGCRSRAMWVRQQAAAPTLMIKNEASCLARVTLAEGRRAPGAPGGVEVAPGKPVTLRPGVTHTWTIATTVPYSERVVRLKVETEGPTWEEPVVGWFEVVGPMPKKAVSLERPQNGAFALRTRDGDVREVPREFWTPAEAPTGAAPPAAGK